MAGPALKPSTPSSVVILTSVKRFSLAGMPGIHAGRNVAGSGIATWYSSTLATRSGAVMVVPYHRADAGKNLLLPYNGQILDL